MCATESETSTPLDTTGGVTLDVATGDTLIYTGKITGSGAFNGETRLQDRQIFLRYKVTRSDGGYDDVRDTLTFRNRIRDGINEWQDEHPENY